MFMLGPFWCFPCARHAFTGTIMNITYEIHTQCHPRFTFWILQHCAVLAPISNPLYLWAIGTPGCTAQWCISSQQQTASSIVSLKLGSTSTVPKEESVFVTKQHWRMIGKPGQNIEPIWHKYICIFKMKKLVWLLWSRFARRLCSGVCCLWAITCSSL